MLNERQAINQLIQIGNSLDMLIKNTPIGSLCDQLGDMNSIRLEVIKTLQVECCRQKSRIVLCTSSCEVLNCFVGISQKGVVVPGIIFHQLVDVLGAPRFKDDKSDVEWRGCIEGEPFSIYTYKNLKSIGQLSGTDFHIGAKNDNIPEIVNEWLIDQLKTS
jgi:hypothetical protein